MAVMMVMVVVVMVMMVLVTGVAPTYGSTNRHLRAKMVIPFLFGSNVPHQILINVLFLLRPRLGDCGCVATRHVDNSLALLHHLPLSYTPYHSPQNADSPRLIPTNGDPYAEHSYPTAITSSHAQRQPSASLKS